VSTHFATYYDIIHPIL